MEKDKLINEIYTNNDNNKKKEEINKIFKNIKDSDNTKDKFMNILKLTKHINDLKESDKINVLKSIDVEFLCLLLRSQNEFKLFTLRLINSLIGSSTYVYLKACFPFINSIIVSYSCYVKNWSNRLKKDVEKFNKENKKGINKNVPVENNWVKKEKDLPIYDNKYNTCEDDKYEDADNYKSCDQDQLKDINIIYNECITFFLKMQPFLKEEEIINNFYFNSENNDLDVDVEMYFFNKRLKKKYSEEKDNVINNEKDFEENNFIVNKKKGNHDTKNKCDLNDINNINPKRYFDNEENSSNNICDDNTSNSDISLLDDDDKEQNFYFCDEKICLIDLIFTILKENINLKELLNKINENKGNNNDKNVDNINNMDKEKIISIYKEKCTDMVKYNMILLNEQCIYISLHFLNNIILKLNYNKYVKEYFHLLNRLVENYNEPKLRITLMNCLTNLNIYIKKKRNIENILDEKNIYKFYANIIYYFSEIKDEKEKEILYTLYSTIYSCLHFIYVNYESIDILKIPLSYMSVELYLFFEDVMKYVSKKEFNNYIFYNKYFKQMIHMICTNVEHILNFLSEHYTWHYEKNEIKNDDKEKEISLSIVENTNIMIEKKKLIKNENTKQNINDKSNNNIFINTTDEISKTRVIQLDLNNMYVVISKIKKIMDILLEFFKDIKDIFKLENEEKKKDLLKFKKEFKEEINVLIKLFCNYLIYENVHYIDDFINLLELFSNIINEDNFYYLLIVKYIHPNRYFNNKIFLSKLLLYILNLNMKNIVQIKILFDLYYKCTFNILNYLKIKELKDISKFSSIIQHNTNNYSFIQMLNISIDKLNHLNFIYILCQNEYQMKMDNISKENIKNLLFFHTHFFLYYYFCILQENNYDIIHEQKNKLDLYKENYYNICNNSIKKNTHQFFLALKILFSISAFLFMRFDSYVITSILNKNEILFIQDCLILSLLNLKFLNEHESKDNELSDMKKKKKKYFFQVLKLVYFIMYYHPYFISLFIFRLKQIKQQDNNNVFFDINKIKMKEEHLSICKLLNNFINNYV
ncbi:conserved Plasmodium protein, unknown function [Plasmodium sp. DRC-Itaito]|nr:conserved Plasmodium protein, unknown function [Plasmodium sp. DRC-Itaito]